MAVETLRRACRLPVVLQSHSQPRQSCGSRGRKPFDYRHVWPHRHGRNTSYVNVQWICKVNDNVCNFSGQTDEAHVGRPARHGDMNVATSPSWKHLWTPREAASAAPPAPRCSARDPREKPLDRADFKHFRDLRRVVTTFASASGGRRPIGLFSLKLAVFPAKPGFWPVAGWHARPEGILHRGGTA